MSLAPECVSAWDGAAASAILLAVPIAALITAATVYLYRRAVERAMRVSAGQRIPGEAPEAGSPPAVPLTIAVASGADSAPPPQLAAGRAAMQRNSAAYLAAGLAHSVVASALWFWLADLAPTPARVLLTWLPNAWPIVLTLMLTATATRRQRALLIGGYFAALLAADAGAEILGLRFKPGFGELLLFWIVAMGQPTLVIALLGNRAWRSVGMIALLIGVMLSGGFMLGFKALGCVMLTTGSPLLFDTFGYLMAALVAGCLVLTWWGLARLVRSYQAKHYSEQMLVLDSWWLLVTLFQLLSVLGSVGIMAFSYLLAFAAYKAVSRAALRRAAGKDAAGAPQSMLMLRVFGHTRRTRRLADQVGQTWRHTGPIDMIGGTDLATALIEPDELMTFWSRRLRQIFVANDADLQRRLATLDEGRDPDGRYRINEFFCHDNTWQATVRALARRSRAVLMDLRGFGKDNRGCEFELGLLLNEVPLQRVVLLIDRNTRLDELTPLLQERWGRLSAASPNRSLTAPTLTLLLADDEGGTLARVLARLYAEAAT